MSRDPAPKPLPVRTRKLVKAFVDQGGRICAAARAAGWTRQGARKALSRAEVREALDVALRREGLGEAQIAKQLAALATGRTREKTYDADGKLVKEKTVPAVQLGALRTTLQLRGAFEAPGPEPPPRSKYGPDFFERMWAYTPDGRPSTAADRSASLHRLSAALEAVNARLHAGELPATLPAPEALSTPETTSPDAPGSRGAGRSDP